MSRVGKLPVKIPSNMLVTLDNCNLAFELGKDKRFYSVNPGVVVTYNDGQILLSRGPNGTSAEVGMERSNIKNLVGGLEKPFKVVLEVNGVGYKVSTDKNFILLSLGYSHEVLYSLPFGVDASFEKPNLIVLSSVDKVLVGQVAAEIISFRRPEPYKGKGIKILGKAIVRKEGKKK